MSFHHPIQELEIRPKSDQRDSQLGDSWVDAYDRGQASLGRIIELSTMKVSYTNVFDVAIVEATTEENSGKWSYAYHNRVQKEKVWDLHAAYK